MTPIIITLPAALQSLADNQAQLRLKAQTVNEAFVQIAQEHDLLAKRIVTRGGQLRPFVNVFLDEQDIRHLNGLETPLDGYQEMTIVASVAGG